MMTRSGALAELSDEELVMRCREDCSDDAFAELVKRHQHGLCRFVARMVGTADHDDVAQDVFLRAYQALPGFRGDATFRTWLYRIARNRCLSLLKRTRRRGETLSLEDEGEEAIHPLLATPPRRIEEELAEQDLTARVQVLITRLPLAYRQVLTLFYLDEMRYEEIATILGVPMGTVKTWIHRARLQLRDLVLDETGGVVSYAATGRASANAKET